MLLSQKEKERPKALFHFKTRLPVVLVFNVAAAMFIVAVVPMTAMFFVFAFAAIASQVGTCRLIGVSGSVHVGFDARRGRVGARADAAVDANVVAGHDAAVLQRFSRAVHARVDAGAAAVGGRRARS